MLKSLKVATPASAATVVVPDSVPPPGLVEMATVTLPVNDFTVFSRASRAATRIAGVMVAPAAGCEALESAGIRGGVNVSWVGAPALTAKNELVVPATPGAVAESV